MRVDPSNWRHPSPSRRCVACEWLGCLASSLVAVNAAALCRRLCMHLHGCGPRQAHGCMHAQDRPPPAPLVRMHAYIHTRYLPRVRAGTTPASSARLGGSADSGGNTQVCVGSGQDSQAGSSSGAAHIMRCTPARPRAARRPCLGLRASSRSSAWRKRASSTSLKVGACGARPRTSGPWHMLPAEPNPNRRALPAARNAGVSCQSSAPVRPPCSPLLPQATALR